MRGIRIGSKTCVQWTASFGGSGSRGVFRRDTPVLSRRGGWLGPPGVRDGRGHRNATGGPSLVTMPRWARSTHILLHELAHTICSRHYPRNSIAAHGWQFAECYAYLVKLFMGADAHDSLRAAYRHNGVRSRPPRKRAPLSPERRAELTAQLAAARERRKELERPAPF